MYQRGNDFKGLALVEKSSWALEAGRPQRADEVGGYAFTDLIHVAWILEKCSLDQCVTRS